MLMISRVIYELNQIVKSLWLILWNINKLEAGADQNEALQHTHTHAGKF